MYDKPEVIRFEIIFKTDTVVGHQQFDDFFFVLFACMMRYIAIFTRTAIHELLLSNCRAQSSA